MASSDEDAFLPTDIDRCKAQIKEMRNRLAVAYDKRRKLRKQLIEEDLNYVVVSKLTEGIRDPTRAQAQDLQGLQKEIFKQLLKSAENCCVQEIISYHRMGGCTIFDYTDLYQVIRLETFYKGCFKEPYYILFLKPRLDVIDQHTLPAFLFDETLTEKLLPHDMPTFLRVVHNRLQVYIARREIMAEIERLANDFQMNILDKNLTCTQVKFDLMPQQSMPFQVEIVFANLGSSAPTRVTITSTISGEPVPDAVFWETEFMERDIIEVLKELLEAQQIGPQGGFNNITWSTPPMISNNEEIVHDSDASEDLDDIEDRELSDRDAGERKNDNQDIDLNDVAELEILGTQQTSESQPSQELQKDKHVEEAQEMEGVLQEKEVEQSQQTEEMEEARDDQKGHEPKDKKETEEKNKEQKQDDMEID